MSIHYKAEHAYGALVREKTMACQFWANAHTKRRRMQIREERAFNPKTLEKGHPSSRCFACPTTGYVVDDTPG